MIAVSVEWPRWVQWGWPMGARRDVVLLNAGLALTTANAAGDLGEGIAMAAESIDSSRARRVLEELVAFTWKLPR